MTLSPRSTSSAIVYPEPAHGGAIKQSAAIHQAAQPIISVVPTGARQSAGALSGISTRSRCGISPDEMGKIVGKMVWRQAPPEL